MKHWIALAVLGFVVFWPVVALSKGQWCNNVMEGQAVNLTLKTATVDGVEEDLGPFQVNLAVKTEFLDKDTLHALVAADGDGGTRVLHVSKQEAK